MENRNIKTKATVEAGIISALIAVMMIFTAYVPFIAGIGDIILPVPIAMLYVRHDYKITLCALTTSAIITSLLFNPITMITVVMTAGITGFMLGYCLKKRKRVSIIITVLMVASLLTFLITTFILISFIEKTTLVEYGNKLMVTMNSSMKESMEIAKNLYMKNGMSEAQIAQFEQISKQFSSETIIKSLGAMVIIMCVISAYFKYWFASVIFRRLKYEVEEMTPFSKIYIPNLLGAVLIILVCLGIILTEKNIVPVGEYIRNSAILIMEFAFTLDGIAVAVHYFKSKFQLSKLVITLIVVFTVFSQMSMIYFFIGLLDIVIDFRKLDPNRIRKV